MDSGGAQSHAALTSDIMKTIEALFVAHVEGFKEHFARLIEVLWENQSTSHSNAAKSL